MNEKHLVKAVEENYHVVFFKNDSGGTSLQSSRINSFLTKHNFRNEVVLRAGEEVQIPWSRDWYTVADVFVSEKIKTVFVAVEYIFEK